MKQTLKLAWLLLFSAAAYAQTSRGTVTGTQCVTIDVSSATATVRIQVTGSGSGTLQPEISLQGQAPVNIQVTPSTSSTAQSTITANGVYTASVAGGTTFLLCGATVTGTWNVFLNASSGVNANGLGGGGGSSPFSAVVIASGDFNVVTGDNSTLFELSSGGGNAVTLPATPPPLGWSITIVSEEALGTAAWIVDGNGNVINGAGILFVNAQSSVTIVSDGTAYAGLVGAQTQFKVGGTPISSIGYLLNFRDLGGILIQSSAGGNNLDFSISNDGTVPRNVGTNGFYAAQTTAIGDTTIRDYTGVGAANMAMITAALYCDTAVAATVTLIIDYVDPSGTTQTIQPSAANCAVLGASSNVQVLQPILISTGLLEYHTTITGSPVYDLQINDFQMTVH